METRIQFHRKVESAKAQLKASAKGEEKVFSCERESIILNVKSSKKLRQFKENQSIVITLYERSSSEQERKVNALASGADEGRDKLR